MNLKVLKLCISLVLFIHFFVTSLGQDALYNVAIFKPAFQSSVYHDWYAEKGNDGKGINYVNCMHTISENNSWWMVDLLDTYIVSSIVLTNLNANNVTAARLNHFQIDVFSKDPRLSSAFPFESGDICYNQTAPLTMGTFTWNCSKPLVGRYVRLVRYIKDELNFCELQVMAALTTPQSCDYTVYENKKLTMTSILNITVSRSLLCGSQCLEKRYTDGCTAFNWFSSTRLCQLLNVDPRDVTVVARLVSVSDVEFYIIKY